MLLFVRIVAGLMGVTLAGMVFTGLMTVRVFIVPDLMLSAFLVLAALTPGSQARSLLLAAGGFSAGVFTVAVARYVIEDGRVNPPLILYIVGAYLVTAAMLWALRESSARSA